MSFVKLYILKKPTLSIKIVLLNSIYFKTKNEKKKSLELIDELR